MTICRLSVVLPLVRHLEANSADAYVIGCFSDPGLALAGESLTEMLDAERVVDRIAEVGVELRDRDVLILGCASMGGYRREIEERLGVPVVDPTQAAMVRAAGLVTLGHRRIA